MTDALKTHELTAEEIAKIALIKERATSLMEALVAAGLIENLTDENRRNLVWVIKALSA